MEAQAENIPLMPTSSYLIRAADLRRRPGVNLRFPVASYEHGAREGWAQRLRRALCEERLVVHYQPIVPLRPGRILASRPSHYEALVRLVEDPGGELIGPAEFLPAAERLGLIAEIDRLVLAAALEQLTAGAVPAGARIAVNMSAQSVCDRSMLSHLQAQLARSGVAPERLMLEVTETCAITDMRAARDFCLGVQRLGASIALDDFGAGFGSLQYLKQLPFRYLKIDGSFIAGVCDSHADRLLVRALVDVARGMGAETIAEYVGDEPTMELLREYGVDYAQGFGIGRPSCPATAFAL
jgi:EAL domain-containing protein (putative c-di-GMP-specific phosphodiesterase class I)